MAEWRWWRELHRRHVVRAAVVYIAAVWALAQGIAQLSPSFGLPAATTRWFVVACAIGFPFWLVCAWYFRITGSGIRRESELARDTAGVRRAGRRLDYWIIAILSIAVVLLLTNLFVTHRNVTIAGLSMTPATRAFRPAAGSLVVLPFQNLSGDPKQQYFSDGITEELTDALGQNAALRVIAWDTASGFRSLGLSAVEIGKRLDVASVLHGSIERMGDEVRVRAELVDATSGYQLWSAHYDASFENIFAVQDRITQAIAAALKVKFAKSDLVAGGTRNPKAHELVLKGRALVNRLDNASLVAAQKDFEEAIALDPDYADAHALLGRALLLQTEASNQSLGDTRAKVRAEARRALVLDPGNADALVELANVDESELDFARAREEYRRALALDPGNAAAHLDYSTVLPLTQAVAQAREAVLLDPQNSFAQNNLATYLLDLGDFEEMLAPAHAIIRLDSRQVDAAFGLAYAYRQLHRYDDMVKAFDLVRPQTPLERRQVEAGRLTYRAAQDATLRPQALAALNRLRDSEPGPDAQLNLVQLYLALDEIGQARKLLDEVCPAQPVDCSDLGVSPIYLPLRDDPGFQALAKKYTTITRE